MRLVTAVLASILIAQAPDPAWLARAENERKPVVVYLRPTRCHPCTAFEHVSLGHPVIDRRLQQVIFVRQTAEKPALELFDRSGTLRARWEGVPQDTTAFGILLDGVLAAAPHFDRAIELGPV